jgi:hypothetical protein
LKNYEEVIGEAVRIDYDESTGKLFLVFEIKNEKLKQEIKKNWTQDIEYHLINKCLIVKD